VRVATEEEAVVGAQLEWRARQLEVFGEHRA
jgi:hypothetical protein